MLRKLYSAIFLLPFFLLSASPARAQELPAGLTQTSSIIREKLTDLKAQSESMTALCETLYRRLETSQTELEQWKEQSTTLSDSLTNISEQLNASYSAIVTYDHRLKTMRRVLAVLIWILSVTVALKAAAYAMYLKGLKVPRWLDILL